MSNRQRKKRKMKALKITSEQIFNAEKPRWNGYGCGHGVHGDTKYNRRKEKQKFRREEW